MGKNLRKFMHTKKTKLNLTFGILALVILIGVIGFMSIEGKSLIDSFYYVIVTLSTVGYGDIHPTTNGGKILSIFLIVGGVGTFMSIFANVADIFISRKEEERRIDKLTTIISLFFTEVGNKFMICLVPIDSSSDSLKKVLTSAENFSLKKSKYLKNELRKTEIKLSPDINIFIEVKKILNEKTNFLVSLLENSNALEYDMLTKLLWSLMHIRDEFMNRRDVENLSDDDIEHLTEDLERVFGLLRIIWIDNMIHTRTKYPNFFGLSMFMNPYNKLNK